MACDHLLLVPFESNSSWIVDPGMRKSVGAQFILSALESLDDLAAYTGRPLSLLGDGAPLFAGEPLQAPAQRSMAAITLTTHLEAAGLRWECVDPGAKEIGWWRRELRQRASLKPLTIGVSTTFVMSTVWIKAFLRIVRTIFPGSRIIVGGYFYATDAAAFLSLDADVHCVGPGETRIAEIVRRVRDGRALDDIPGLYLKRDGGMVSTGTHIGSQLQALPPPNWRLAERIFPYVDLSKQALRVGVETQRGCVFKCTYCTFRTLALPDLTSVDQAVMRIKSTGQVPNGDIQIVDATATFPRDRWLAIMQRLVEEGGAPHPIWAYARVSDINDEVGALMAKAGVGIVFVGQESGDQRMLDLMRKHTRVSHVRPAVEVLSRHGISAVFGIIHGFPRENSESARSTRDLLKTVNDSVPWPVCMLYVVTPFQMLDFASIAQDAELQTEEHYFTNYKTGGMSGEAITEECVRTLIEVSEVPRAPVCNLVLSRSPDILNGLELARHPGRDEIHRWLKSIERGLGIFLKHRYFGAPIDLAALKQVRAEVNRPYQQGAGWDRLQTATVARVRARAMGRLRREWERENASGKVGKLTRAMVASTAYSDTHDWRWSLHALRTGSLPLPVAATETLQNGDVRQLATTLVDQSIARARRAKLKVVSD